MYVLPPLPRRSDWASSSLFSPSRNSLPRKRRRVGLHIVLFEACSAFTRVAARTLAPSPICDSYTVNRRRKVTPDRRPKLTPLVKGSDGSARPGELVGVAQPGR